MKYLIFTYGTLMKGQVRESVMETSRYVCDAMLEDYGLYETGTYPAAVKMPGYRVYGEVYEVDQDVKDRLDEIEGTGYLYDFVPARVLTDEGYIDVGFYEFIDDGRVYPIRKPEGKWNTVRNDVV